MARPSLEMEGGIVFITGDVEEALERAREAAGDHRFRFIGEQRQVMRRPALRSSAAGATFLSPTAVA